MHREQQWADRNIVLVILVKTVPVKDATKPLVIIS